MLFGGVIATFSQIVVESSDPHCRFLIALSSSLNARADRTHRDADEETTAARVALCLWREGRLADDGWMAECARVRGLCHSTQTYPSASDP